MRQFATKPYVKDLANLLWGISGAAISLYAPASRSEACQSAALNTQRRQLHPELLLMPWNLQIDRQRHIPVDMAHPIGARIRCRLLGR